MRRFVTLQSGSKLPHSKKNDMIVWINIWLLLAVNLPPADTALERGMDAFQRRDFSTAERELLQAIRDQPSNARAHKFLGMVYTAQERFQLAEEPFRKACSIDPREENACYYLGRLCYTLNRFEDSLNAFDKALRNPAERGRTFHGMALTQEALGRGAEAERDFKESVRAGEKAALTESVGYGCSSDRLVHFGLGIDSVIKTIEIDWPSGIKQRLENLRAGRFLKIEGR